MVDSVHIGAGTPHDAAFFVTAGKSFTRAGSRKGCSDLAADPRPKPMHDRAREPGTLIGRKHRDQQIEVSGGSRFRETALRAASPSPIMCIGAMSAVTEALRGEISSETVARGDSLRAQSRTCRPLVRARRALAPISTGSISVPENPEVPACPVELPTGLNNSRLRVPAEARRPEIDTRRF
jgi:hypothetical protein